MRVRLTRLAPISAVEGSMTPVEGETEHPPVVGYPFKLIRDSGQPLTLTDTAEVGVGDGTAINCRTLTGVVWRVELIGPEVLAMSRRHGQA